MDLLNKNNRLWLILVLFILSAQFLFFIDGVLAQEIYGPPNPNSGGGTPLPGGGTPGGAGGLRDPLGGKTIFTILNRVIGYMIKIGAPIVALMVIYGGFLILTAGDKPEQVTNGKNTILYAVVGYTIILCSWGIIYIIGEVLGARLR